MVEILHQKMPAELEQAGLLPGVQPLTDGRWLRVDEVYAAQMAYRRQLITTRRKDVLWQAPEAEDATHELFEAALELFPGMGITLSPDEIICPDGYHVPRGSDHMIETLGQVVQEDLCILQKRGDEHVLTAAVLCFPASWTLAEKAGRPLRAIHTPVAGYDAGIAARVQRLFDGVQPGRPLWRNNYLHYQTADLYQPRPQSDPARVASSEAGVGYHRAERQCIVRLPQTKAVVFSIHSYVVRADKV